MEKETYNVYSFSLFLALAKNGILPIGTKQKEEDPAKTLFFYEDNKELRDIVKDYTEKWKTAKGEK